MGYIGFKSSKKHENNIGCEISEHTIVTVSEVDPVRDDGIMFYNSLNYDVTSFDNKICSKKLVINRGCGHVFQYVNTKTMKRGVGYDEYNEAFDEFVENLIF